MLVDNFIEFSDFLPECSWTCLSEQNTILDVTNFTKLVEEPVEMIFIELLVDPVLDMSDKQIDPTTESYLEAYRAYNSDFHTSVIKPEPILSEASSRYTVYPIMYPGIWKNYKDQQKINWVIEEIDLSKDVDHWKKNLNEPDRIFIMHVLAFFSAFDGIVDENIKKNLIDMIKIKEAECAYGKQFDMENVHGEMYSLMLDTFVQDPILKDKLINSIRTMYSVKKKAQW